MIENASAILIPASFCRLIRVDETKCSPEFVYYALQDLYAAGGTWEFQNQSTGISNFQFEVFRKKYTLPNIDRSEQTAIAEVLGALDDKISTNTRIATASADISRSLFERALESGSVETSLTTVTTLISRGITPSYSDEAAGTTKILNQKCVRDQRVLLAPSRRTVDSRVREDKVLVVNDVLVNSTGQGTLGRVARWTRIERVTTDSHISIVRFDANLTNPITAGYGLLRMQSAIEELGEGSTGQTELSRVDLGKLRILLPNREIQDQLGEQLHQISSTQNAYLAENDTLAATRDALLPQLMSGQLRVKDAERSLAGVL
ncbi:restriction endonuclease subunit S [Cryobacterium sp. TMS1-13-1]|uniref:restriction endonuclease subunit S n=1 Tax=Cryobacterium sp. TMS1-13-1 TaxID=1259220 RepID=UPI00106CFF70|nr:restriction endonuclease subunit S [Cryobacterium sp. TMS1-13-1]TFD23378.1 restriction endonuclease subunit S [Cryobacterium sp. TMS1-13-1]